MKFIIKNMSELDELQCLKIVMGVVEMGRISNEGKQYCYVTTWTVNDKEYICSTGLNKKSDCFVISGPRS
jgi:hypothetical protein